MRAFREARPVDAAEDQSQITTTLRKRRGPHLGIETAGPKPSFEPSSRTACDPTTVAVPLVALHARTADRNNGGLRYSRGLDSKPECAKFSMI
jgi:hypothetical protein